MEKRVRLTARRRKASDNIPYPGTVNQEDRQFVERDKYDTFEHTINYELPDMRTEWRNDARDEIGFPIAEDHSDVVGVEDKGMTVASIRQAASKAVKLSMLLLGNKVPEKLIEAQANDFMRLGSAGLERALARFAQTETLYRAADEDADEDDAPKAKKGADEEAPAAEKKEETTAKKSAEEAPAEEKKEETTAKKGADEAPAAEEKKEETTAKKGAEKKDLPPEFLENIKKKEDDKDDAPKAKKSSDDADEDDAPKAKKSSDDADEDDAPKAKKSSDDADEDDAEEAPKAKKSSDDEDEDDSKEARVAELDIELAAADEDDEGEDEKSASILSALYEEVQRQGAASRKSADGDEGADEDADEDDKKARSASAKARGAQKLGGQPRIASENMSVKDISAIWGETPDVSGIFN